MVRVSAAIAGQRSTSAVLVACTLASSCASLIGVDESYSEVDDAAISNAGAGGTDGSGGSGGNGDSGGNGGSGNSGGNGGGGAATGGTSGTQGADATAGDGPTGSEICDNSGDDDADGRIDCFDRDCDSSAACVGKCNDVVTLRCNVARAGEDSGGNGATQRITDYDCSPGNRSGPELAYRFGGNAGDRVFVELYALGGDLGLFLADAATGAACDAKSGCVAAADDATGTRPEALSFSPLAGHDYYLIVDGVAAAARYSISVQCSTGTGCSPTRAIEAGQTIDSSNTPGPANVTNNITSYSCGSTDLTSPETAFMFTPVTAGDYRVTLQNLTTNLNLYILAAPNCSSTCLHATSKSSNPSTQDEAVTITAIANRTYYIVVDGYNVGNFRLAVTAL